MSIIINIKESDPQTKWETIKNGDFVILEGNTKDPVNGVFRVFTISSNQNESKKFIIVPIMDGPFEEGMYPYIIESPYPTISKIIQKINIEIEI